MQTKSQAALEFLTTYGWAFLVIMIMVGSLAYFGILSPSKLLPNRCNLGSEFSCVDYQIKDGGTLTDLFKVKLKNNLGEPIIVLGGSLKKEDSTDIVCTAVPSQPASPPAPSPNWGFARTQDLVWSGCPDATWTAEEKAKVLFSVKFKTVAGGYDREVQGEVYSTVTS